jgi:hypothetical protein
MTTLKFADKIAYKKRKLSKLLAHSLIVSQKGMTLIEIMIASGISIVVSMGIAGIYIFAVQQFTILVNMNTAQENVLWLAYHTKSLMSQAVNLQDVEGCTPDPSSIWGCIPDRTTTNAGTQVTVAAFQREWSVGWDGSGNTIPSELVPTAIFFQQPSATVDGRIFLDINTPVGGLITPGNDDIVYDRVVQYDLNTNIEPIYGFNQATGVEVTIATRYHRTTDELRMRWCTPSPGAPAPGVGSCTDGAAASDITMRFNVGLRNNHALEKTPSNQPRSIHGGIYYYRFIPPLFEDVQ